MNVINAYAIPGVVSYKDPFDIVKMVEKTFDVSIEHIKSKDRHDHIRVPRQVLAYLLVKYGLTTRKAGFIINRDRATVIHSVKVVEDTIDTNEDFKRLIEKLKIRL
jgi:chromosomal replication initiation ATPase DnaA